jgi:hypothetical protein
MSGTPAAMSVLPMNISVGSHTIGGIAMGSGSWWKGTGVKPGLATKKAEPWAPLFSS